MLTGNVLNTGPADSLVSWLALSSVLTYLEWLLFPVSTLFLFPKFFKHKIDQLSDFRGTIECIKYIHSVTHPSPRSGSRTLSSQKETLSP